MNRRSGIRYITTITLSFFLSLFLLALISGVILLRTVVNPWYIVRQIEKSGFSENAALELREIFISYGHASGVSADVMASLITAEHVADAAEAGVMESFDVSAGFNFSNYSNEVFMVLYEYAAAQGMEITSEVREGIGSLADLCADALRNYVNSPIFDILAGARHYSRHLFIAIAASIILSHIVISLIPYVNRRVTRWIDGYIYALGTVTLICIIIPVAVHSTGITNRLQITPLSYNRFISAWIEGILNGYLVALIPLTVLIGVCVTVRVIRWKKRREIYKNR